MTRSPPLRVLLSSAACLAAAAPACSGQPRPERDGAAKYALVLVDLGAGVNVSSAQARAAMFGTEPSDRSFASFYSESSYGKYKVVGDVRGPFRYEMHGCDLAGMVSAIEAHMTSDYDHLIYYFPRAAGCSFGGLGEEGAAARPARRSWMNGTLACAPLMHEPAHNLGLRHANAMACPGASFSATPATSCAITEYGSFWTPMGNGCHQLNGYERWYEGWVDGCNGVQVRSTGRFRLAPLGQPSPAAAQVLQIPMAAARAIHDPQAPDATLTLRDYYVELRAPAGLFDQYEAGGPRGAFTEPTVTVYVSDDVRAGAGTVLLDMDPASAGLFDGLRTGIPFRDPSGSPTITLRSVSATEATVDVTIRDGAGPSTCIGAAPLAMTATVQPSD